MSIEVSPQNVASPFNKLCSRPIFWHELNLRIHPGTNLGRAAFFSGCSAKTGFATCIFELKNKNWFTEFVIYWGADNNNLSCPWYIWHLNLQGFILLQELLHDQLLLSEKSTVVGSVPIKPVLLSVSKNIIKKFFMPSWKLLVFQLFE